MIYKITDLHGRYGTYGQIKNVTCVSVTDAANVKNIPVYGQVKMGDTLWII